ncbi:MAG: glutamine--fructose-6-phosphate transaminase (isomerizing) [Caldisericota bacterium]|nr:glutamine--fructose-6-phosphate transaminase (isomerizing) [Caldisericota bacterium]
MCGIIGYVGPRKVVPVIIEGLRKLEYRGYDSAGMAIIEAGKLVVVKKRGKLRELEEAVRGNAYEATTGIGHTRWATHGRVEDRNAHPHMDCKGEIAVIHNGIIENYQTLRSDLIKKGHAFSSETDTEVIAHLLEEQVDAGRDLLDAVRGTAHQLQGAYAFLVVASRFPGRVIAVRNLSPLVLGVGDGEMIFSSDTPALLDYTHRIVPLHDGDVVEINDRGYFFYALEDGHAFTRAPMIVQWSAASAEKQGYKHFMLKEIYEQPVVIRDTLYGRFDVATGRVDLKEFADSPVPERISIVAAGTSYHASRVGKYLLEQLARIPTEVSFSSEYRYQQPIVQPGTLGIAVTQSGETIDTLAALRLQRQLGARVVAITNRPESSAVRESDVSFITQAGIEIGVAATKSFMAQLIAFYLMAISFGQRKGTIDQEASLRLGGELAGLSQKCEQVLEYVGVMEAIARKFYQVHDMIFVGRGVNYPIALEGALKMKEISYIHAEGYAAGELKHGPIALLEQNVPVIGLLPRGPLYEKVYSNLQESNARESPLVILAESTDATAQGLASDFIPMPIVGELFSPVLYTVPLQLLAYYTADRKGLDVDQPRNLAKSVTVE